MPMRRIATSLPQIGFEDQASPLSEGLLHASATLGELWPRLAQIKADQRRQDQSMQERRMEFQQREADRQERARLWSTGREDAISQRREAANATATERKHQDDVNAARYGTYVGDDPQLKAISDQVRGDRHGAGETKLDDDAEQHAATEIAPLGRGFRTMPVLNAKGEQTLDNNGRPITEKVPLNGPELDDQNDRIGSRAQERRGHPFKPVPGFRESLAADPDVRGFPGVPTLGPTFSGRDAVPADASPSDPHGTPRLWTQPPAAPAAAPAPAAPPAAVAPPSPPSPLDEAELDPAWKAKLDRKFPGRAQDPAQRQAALAYVMPHYTPPAPTNAPDAAAQ